MEGFLPPPGTTININRLQAAVRLRYEMKLVQYLVALLICANFVVNIVQAGGGEGGRGGGRGIGRVQ